VRTFFTLITAVLAISLLLSGGLLALQTAAIIIALPFSVVMLLICWSTVIAFGRERYAYDRARRAQLVDYVGDYYGLEVEDPTDRGILTTGSLWSRLLRRRGTSQLGNPAGALPDSTRDVPEDADLRHASERTLMAQAAEPDGVSTDDVDEVVRHDSDSAQDVRDVPDRGDPR